MRRIGFDDRSCGHDLFDERKGICLEASLSYSRRNRGEDLDGPKKAFSRYVLRKM